MNPFNNIRTKVTEFKAERAARRANRANARREEEAQADADHPVFNGDTRPLRVQETTSKRSALAIAGILIAILVVISLIVGNVSLRNDYNALVSASETTKKDLSVEANALKQKAADTEKLVAEKDAANKALQDQLNAAQQMGPANPVAPPVVNPNTRSDAQQMVDQFGYTQDKGWTTDITAKAWADYANNHPGDFVMGASFAKTPEEAAAAAVNNPSIAGTRAQKENPFNWVLVYNPACMEYDAMAFQKAADGTFDWDSGFRECGVMIWVNVASGGQFRLLCDNGLKAPPVPTNKPASFPEVTPNVKLMPPVVPPVKTIVRNPPVDVCPDKPGNQPEGTNCDAKDLNDDVFKDDDIDGTPAPPGPIDTGDVVEPNPAGPPSTDGNAPGDEVVDLPADNADGDVVPDHGTPPPVPVDVPSNPGGAPLEGDVDPDAAPVATPQAPVTPAVAPVTAPVPAPAPTTAPAPADTVVEPAPAPAATKAPVTKTEPSASAKAPAPSESAPVQTQVASTDSHTSATVIATSSDEKSVG